MKPFFPFYGSKYRLISKYPRPEYDTIIEPFAGSACYSAIYYNRKIVLVEKDPLIASVWAYLVKSSRHDIVILPDLESGQTVDDLNICEEAKRLIGFWVNPGSAQPKKSMSKFTRPKGALSRILFDDAKMCLQSGWCSKARTTIANQVERIKHWKIINEDYATSITNEEATWFIDPPYQNAGKWYRYGSKNIDYILLASWCKQRRGQIIVCENEGASWLPFQYLTDIKTVGGRRSTEVVFLKGCTEQRRRLWS